MPYVHITPDLSTGKVIVGRARLDPEEARLIAVRLRFAADVLERANRKQKGAVQATSGSGGVYVVFLLVTMFVSFVMFILFMMLDARAA